MNSYFFIFSKIYIDKEKSMNGYIREIDLLMVIISHDIRNSINIHTNSKHP